MKLKLLVVEDHPDMRARVVSLLQRDFDVVGSVASGTAAVEAENKLKPDILILDVSLPILDGVQVAKYLKAQGCKAKIVFMTASGDADQMNACLDAGGDAYVWKTMMGSDLSYAIKEVLAGRTFVSSWAS